jgi:hypothetical protein
MSFQQEQAASQLTSLSSLDMSESSVSPRLVAAASPCSSSTRLVIRPSSLRAGAAQP